MSNLTRSLRKGLAGGRNMSVLQTVLIYQDLDAGLLAKRFCNRLEKDLDVKCQLNDRVWRFDVLAIPEVRNAAASAAANANLVIFSKSDCTELSEKVKEWLDMWMWLIDQGNPALIALFGAPRSESAPVCMQLQGATRSNGVDFFSSTIPKIAQSEEPRSMRKQLAHFEPAILHGPFG